MHNTSIYQNSYMYITEVNFFISLYIPKFTSINPMYQNSASVHIYIQIDISKYMSLKQIYIKIYIFFMVEC